MSEGDAIETFSAGFAGYSDIQDRVTGIRLETGGKSTLHYGGIELTVFCAPADVPNLAFLIQAGGYVLFHTGDMFINHKNSTAFQAGGLPEAGIDYALVPYTWFFDPGGPEFLAQVIGAQESIPMHYIDSNTDEIATLFRTAFPEVILLIQPLDSISR
jgi:hypothetical protein